MNIEFRTKHTIQNINYSLPTINNRETYKKTFVTFLMFAFFKEQQCNTPQVITNMHNKYTGLNKANQDIASASLSNFCPKQSRNIIKMK